MAYNPTYYASSITTSKSTQCALASDVIRKHKSEYLDDIKFQCGSLRYAADCIHQAAEKLDKARREGKAWDSGAIMTELSKADAALRKLYQTAER